MVHYTNRKGESKLNKRIVCGKDRRVSARKKNIRKYSIIRIKVIE